ncbi:MAG: excisionase family DNA binding protein [Planctomycetota bacterium]|jgi:excisionase family DNA binding protein
MELVQKELQQIKQFIKEQSILRKEILTLEEITWYLGLSKSSVYKLTSKREIPFYSPGGKKLYFKKSEIDNWVYESKITPIDEVENEVENYLSRTNKI